MREVAADPEPLIETFGCCAGRTRMRITEFKMVVHEIEDRLHAGPARLHLTELVPGKAAELVDLAITAPGEITQRLVR